MRPCNQEALDTILKFVNKYYQDHHYSPTINEVAVGVGVVHSTTHRYIQVLGERGLLDYDRGIMTAPQSAKMKTVYVSALLVGSIRCGSPEEEEETIEEYVSLPASAIPWSMPVLTKTRSVLLLNMRMKYSIPERS